MRVRTPVIEGPTPNGDEKIGGVAKFIGNFHKTLPHNNFGEVDAADYQQFVDICRAGDFEDVATGPLGGTMPPSGTVARLVNPQCGRSDEALGPDPLRMEMQPAPQVLHNSTAAEFTELCWMTALRDEPFDTWSAAPVSTKIGKAVTDLKTAFGKGLAQTSDVGGLRLGIDLPESGGALDLRPQTLFRMGLRGEDQGPLVSQFLLQDFNYGAQLISQKQAPYKEHLNFLDDVPRWLYAQQTGYDEDFHDYPGCNDARVGMGKYFEPVARRSIATMRDLARFVNRDALHQAYFNAALQLLNWGRAAPFDKGMPYAFIHGYQRQTGFGTLGGPNLLALVSEVATRALKVVWRQKWLVHRRLRPEAYGGLLEMQQNQGRAYGLPAWLPGTDGVGEMRGLSTATGTFLLPLAFTAGSPAHPAYGAGHACVAGACVTILKAWFEDTNYAGVIAASSTSKDPLPEIPAILQPGLVPAPYAGADKGAMSVHGELNKLAANIAMGRAMGGVHWRSDNTRSLRLGERIATIILSRLMRAYAERPLSLNYQNFDRDDVTIESNGKVLVSTHPELETFYSRF